MRADDGQATLNRPWYRLFKIVVVALGVVYALSTLVPVERSAFLDTWFYSGVLVLTSVLGLLRPLLVRAQRPAWACVGLAIASWSAGDIYWSATFSDVDASEIPIPSLADVFYVAMYPLAYAGLILLARASVRRLPASVWLDGIVTSLAAGALFAAVAIDDVLAAAAGGGGFAETMTNLSYPVGDLVLVVVAVAALAMVGWRRDPQWWLLGLGAAAFAVADTAYLFGLANDTYDDGGWVDGTWMIGLTLMALSSAVTRTRSVEEPRVFAALVVPILFSLLALGVLVVGTFVDVHPIATVMACACLIAAGVRTALTFEQTRELARTRVAAETDELTGLGNRRLLDARLPASLENLPAGHSLVLTIISVDHLVEINRILGYPAGDRILQVVGLRLTGQLPPGTIAARLGGAELAVARVVPRVDPEQLDAEIRALTGALAAPVAIGQAPVHLELSAGIAVAPTHAQHAAELLRCAADALHAAKANRTSLEIYEPGRHGDVLFGLLPDLMQAVRLQQFVAYFEPIVDSTGRVGAIEAVLRWHHPTHGAVNVDAVRPLAMQVGLSRQLTLALLQPAIDMCVELRRIGVDVGVSLDVTAADILDGQLPYDLARTINKAGIPPSRITLEIPEDVLLIDQRRIARAIGQLRHFGVRLALDHYGRTAPSLARLRNLQVDELKLDVSFVTPILDSAQDAAIVRSTIDFARSLRIVTVVEGVNSRQVLDAVAASGCDLAQGPALVEPMSGESLQSWLLDPVRRPHRHTQAADQTMGRSR